MAAFDVERLHLPRPASDLNFPYIPEKSSDIPSLHILLLFQCFKQKGKNYITAALPTKGQNAHDYHEMRFAERANVRGWVDTVL